MNETQIRALETAIAALQSIVATQPEAGTAPAAQAPAPEPTFVDWLRETAPARKARKAHNAEMAAWLRSKNLPTNGPVWEACKAGERSVRALRKLAA